MSLLLVTGGTGFLGEHVCRVLVEQGHHVRALARSRSDVLIDLGVELIRGDVTDAGDLSRALASGNDGETVAAVFHLAGMVSRDPDDTQRMMRLHVDGTRRVLEAMASHGVPRMILASTSGTVAISEDEEILDENAGYATEIAAGWPYYASKIYQEKLAFELGKKLAIDVIAICPSLLLGPGDRRLSSTGDVRTFLRKQIPVVPTGGMNFVDVRDAADATAAALTRGRAGERYLLGGPNWTMKDFFGKLSRVSKVSPPHLRLPKTLNRWGASLMAEIARKAGREPTVDRISVEMAEHYWWFDSSKAEAELGFASRDPLLTLHDTVEYLRAGVDWVA